MQGEPQEEEAMPAIWRSVDRIHIAGLVALTAFGLASTSSFADTEPGSMPDFLMTWDASLDTLDPDTYNPDEFQTQQTAWGTWQVGGQDYTGWRYVGGLTNEFWTLTWDCIVNEDPFVVATINVTNNAASTQNFSNYMSLPISGPINPTLMNGSVSAGLVNNSPFATSATLASGVDPIYQAFIDPSANPPASSASRTMWNGFSLTAPQFVGAANANDAFAGEIGPGAFSSIALKLQFDLSAGDTASVTGIFEITEVPGPAGLAVFALFGLVGTRRRR
jgi:MYXO-CTERM domain-containing protein